MEPSSKKEESNKYKKEKQDEAIVFAHFLNLWK